MGRPTPLRRPARLSEPPTVTPRRTTVLSEPSSHLHLLLRLRLLLLLPLSMSSVPLAARIVLPSPIFTPTLVAPARIAPSGPRRVSVASLPTLTSWPATAPSRADASSLLLMLPRQLWSPCRQSIKQPVTRRTRRCLGVQRDLRDLRGLCCREWRRGSSKALDSDGRRAP